MQKMGPNTLECEKPHFTKNELEVSLVHVKNHYFSFSV